MDKHEKKDIMPETNEAAVKKDDSNNGISITPHDHDHNEENHELCILCEKKPAYKTDTVDSDLCKECRELFVKTPFKAKGFIMVFVLIALALSGIMLIAPQAATIKSTIACYKSIENGDYASASNQITNMTIENIGWKTASKLGKLLYKLDSPSDLTYLVENFFYNEADGTALAWQDKVGKANLNAPWNKELKKTYNYVINLQALEDKHFAAFMEYYEKLYYGEITEKDIPYDKLIKQYQASLSQAQTNEEKGIISYCMLTVAGICNKDLNTQLAYCKNVMKYLPECRWYYIENLITLDIQAGNYSEAKKYIDIFSTTNPKYESYAKRYNAILLRYEGKYDEAMQIFKTLIDDYNNNGIDELFYDALKCSLLAGDLEAAFEYSVECYEYQAYANYETINLYYMLGKKLNKNLNYDGIIQDLEYNGTKVSPTVEKYLKGEITIEEIFKDGEVVFE